ncbi:hypothetical protein ABH940_002843 [Streptacidiphilus sp. BW17]|uniref:hypothetical protein n=1 Tax=Streptacidiphilus sp. BW17 TaxID=3156274 RepID=UPI0035130F30
MGLFNRSGEAVYVATVTHSDGSPYLTEADQQLKAAGAIGAYDGSRNVYGESGVAEITAAAEKHGLNVSIRPAED